MDTHASNQSHAEGQQHPIRLYITVWIWLFILSVGSYMVDILHVQGYLRWGLVATLMMLKAGLIVAVFMHVAWERLALTYVILVPPLLLMVFVAIMALEGSYTEWMRLIFM
ncbi:cytochrome C oxidase subunit IV family protein [Pelagibacterium halotolerans]|uniref:cytochrome C oxidase subunit IV family protein n=1 Tax=Pelagibacterium halotolerans TaxID=531813 RepID=UPI00384CC019